MLNCQQSFPEKALDFETVAETIKKLNPSPKIV